MIPFEYLPPGSARRVRPGISFVQGDLTQMLRESPVDALLISAFKDNYAPTSTSLIGALARKGVDVAQLAQHKSDDLRSAARFWLSQPLPSVQAEMLGFGRIICFERERDEALADSVMAIGQALSVAAITHNVRSVAMPLIATGNQGFAVQDVLPPLLDSLTRHMRKGSRLESVVIAAYDDGDVAIVRDEVARFRAREPIAATDDSTHDVFVSYRHSDADCVDCLMDAILTARPHTDIWLDRTKLELGDQWNDEIAHAIDRSRLFVPFYSKQYFESIICREELAAAHIRRRALKTAFIVPVLLDDVELTSYHQMTQYKDSRVRDMGRIREAGRVIAEGLDGDTAVWSPTISA